MSSSRVELFLQSFVAELHHLRSLGLLEEKEIRALNQRRRHFEYEILNRNVKLVDFYEYIQFELNFNSLITQRRRRLKIPTKLSQSMDFFPIRRVFFIFERALKRFHSSPSLFLQFAQYAKRIGANKKVSAILPRALARHPHCDALWIFAANCQFEGEGNIGGARATLQRAIRMMSGEVKKDSEKGVRSIVPSVKNIFLFYFHMEMTFTAMTKERRWALGIEGKEGEENEEKSKEWGEHIALKSVKSKTPKGTAPSPSPSPSPSAPSPSEVVDTAVCALLLPYSIVKHAIVAFSSSPIELRKSLLMDFVSLIPHPFNSLFRPLSHRVVFAEFLRRNFPHIEALRGEGKEGESNGYRRRVQLTELMDSVVQRLLSDFPSDFSALSIGAEWAAGKAAERRAEEKNQKIPNKKKSSNSSLPPSFLFEFDAIEFLFSHLSSHPSSLPIKEFVGKFTLDKLTEIALQIAAFQQNPSNVSEDFNATEAMGTMEFAKGKLSALFDDFLREISAKEFSSKLPLLHLGFLSAFSAPSPSSPPLEVFSVLSEYLKVFGDKAPADFVVKAAEILWKKMEFLRDAEGEGEGEREGKEMQKDKRKRAKAKKSSDSVEMSDEVKSPPSSIFPVPSPLNPSNFTKFILGHFDRFAQKILDDTKREGEIEEEEEEEGDNQQSLQPLSYSHLSQLSSIALSVILSDSSSSSSSSLSSPLSPLISRIQSVVSSLSAHIIPSTAPSQIRGQNTFKWALTTLVHLQEMIFSPWSSSLWDFVWNCRYRDCEMFLLVLRREWRECRNTQKGIQWGQHNTRDLALATCEKVASLRRHFELAVSGGISSVSLWSLWCSVEKSVDPTGKRRNAVWQRALKELGESEVQRFIQIEEQTQGDE